VSGGASDPPGRFTLRLPADPAYSATARMFSSAVARHFDADEEAIEDLKLAVSEACTGAMRDGADAVRITARHEPPFLWFEIPPPDEPAGEEDTPSPDEMAAGLGLEIIRALFEDAEIGRSEEGDTVVRFPVPVP
jgi:serine/threonine-protein kinase RsbW